MMHSALQGGVQVVREQSQHFQELIQTFLSNGISVCVDLIRQRYYIVYAPTFRCPGLWKYIVGLPV